MRSQLQRSEMLLKSATLPIMYLGCVWKWIRSCEQNSAPESRPAGLNSVKIIKMSRLAIDRLLIYSRLTGHFDVAKQTVQILSTLKGKMLREDNWNELKTRVS